jgi:hypothetical protein
MAIRTIVDVGNAEEQQPTATSSDDKEDKKSQIAKAWRSPPKTMAKVTAEVTASETLSYSNRLYMKKTMRIQDRIGRILEYTIFFYKLLDINSESIYS